MRPALLAWALAALYAVPILTAPPGKAGAKEAVEGEPSSDGEGESTTFNGIKVPPMKDIGGDKFAETIKEGYW
jgi:protein disulfide-isomerase